MKLPRIMITATGSGSGKTVLTCGIMRALAKKGMHVSSFKCGPDYIDPMFHEAVLGSPSYNLDTFFVETDLLSQLFINHASKKQIAVVEGVMGYYDGIGGNTTKASAYDVARRLEIPVVLLVDCKGASTSIVPIIKGFLEYRGDSNIKGVLLNKISPMLYPSIKELIEKELSIQVLGYVKYKKELELKSRHLGLITPGEIKDLRQRFDELADELAKTIDFEALQQVAENAVELKEVEEKTIGEESVKIGIAKDEAFSFHYADNLELLKKSGAILCFFSPLRDLCLPEGICGLILNGGYPEVYAKQLEANHSMRTSILKAIQDGMPVIAECGGFMYLQERLETLQGNSYQMVGALKGKCIETTKLQRFGYLYLKAKTNGMLLECGEEIPVHEFHYFDCEENGEDFQATKASGIKRWECGFSNSVFYGGFPHLYYYSFPKMIERFLNKSRERK